MELYLVRVARHAELVQALAELQEVEDPGDINWLLRQEEWEVNEARKAFSAHRAGHSR